MLKCEIGKGIQCKMMLRGSGDEITVDVLNIIKHIFNAFQRKSPARAEVFRTELLALLQDPKSPIFDGSGESTVIDLSAFQGGAGK